MTKTRVRPNWVITEDYSEEVLGFVKSGKEAQVRLVRRTASDGRWCLLAAKSYRARHSRAFRRDIYLQGRERGFDPRTRRAIAKGTAYGKASLEGTWISNEVQMLRRLWEAGVSVPYPVGWSGNGQTMQYVGTFQRAAPRLIDVRIARDEATGLFDRLVEEVTRMLSVYVVHADLSAFNVLLQDGRPWIIDLPQAVDIAYNPHWQMLLTRDIANLCAYFERYGLMHDPLDVYGSVTQAAGVGG